MPAASPLAGRSRLTPRMLAASPLILTTSGSPLRQAVDGAFAQDRIKLPAIHACDGGRETRLRMVASGLGAALFLRFEADGDPILRQLPAEVVVKPTSRQFRPVPYYLAIRKGRSPSPAPG